MQALVFLWLLVLTAVFGAGVEVTIGGGASEATFTIFGVAVDSPGGVLVLVLVATVLFVLARGIASAARRRGRTSLRTALAATMCATVLAVPSAAAWSRSYWGYWFRRPAADAGWWTLARVSAISELRCEGSPRAMRCVAVPAEPVSESIADCEHDPYYCLDERLPVSLENAGLLPARPGALTREHVAAIERALSSGIVMPAEPGYHGDRALHGVAVSGVSADGRAVLAAAVQGGQLSNDHYPHYELVAGAGGNILRSRVFFWDVAGFEGFELGPMLVLLLAGGFVICVPLALIAAAVVQRFRPAASAHSSQ